MLTAITASALEVRFGDLIALSGIDFKLPSACSLAVIGANGSGKSTLLGAIAGTVVPTSGWIHVLGQPALVLQSTEVDRSLPITVYETVGLARYPALGLFKRFGRDDRAAINGALERLDIADLAPRQLHELSGGQRQRAVIAQGLAQESEILLLDEPITGLDVVSQKVILEVIDDELAAGRTVVLTTHDLDDARRCHNVLLLDNGPIAFGSPSQVLTPENLRRAFGGRFVQIGDHLMLDDDHHHHHHPHHDH